MLAVSLFARRAAAVTAAALALTALASAAPAQAQTAASRLELTVVGLSGDYNHWTLTCGPDDGSHPNPWAACADLYAVDGYLEEREPDPNPCPRIYDPVEATMEGYWFGRPVFYRQQFSNQCLMTAATGAVFPPLQ
ncbi:SSI family serine proteinase inhibitor [Streptosporangium sp. KLBMP 9127]|nr:SSI family serine proteinase inhibitor [Streptosporangium sp. KLBMP 9127]